MEGIDLVIEALREKLPLELIGFVLAAVVLIGFVVLAFFLKRFQHPQPPTEAVSAPMNDDTTLVGKLKARSENKPLKPAKALKEKLKTREVAMALGFIADEVERDMPVLGKDREIESKSGVLERVFCARYYFPEHVSGSNEWKLLRRPAQITPAPLLLTEGWILQIEKGELSHLAIGAINQLIADKHWQNHALEIEVARSAVHFYWDEIGGKDKVEIFKTLVEKLNQRSP
ncbi:MAG: hypothetical protein Q8K65_12080 [Alphaproteobacteria bacterium]|nr:hypothetical protein [Alphaproteobacteria bacterium]